MKLQYLGDSKDSFKWDYHDYLITSLDLKTLNILIMLTEDDKTKEGNTNPDWFPARGNVIEFCHMLKENRQLTDIKKLPKVTGGNYVVNLHNPYTNIKANRKDYYKSISNLNDQLIFIDPDNGFEPEKSCTEKHVKYTEINNILNQISENSVISVFHHFRRITFIDDFNRIKERILMSAPFAHVTAIYWHQLMFVLISKSEKTNKKLVLLNSTYSEKNPVLIT